MLEASFSPLEAYRWSFYYLQRAGTCDWNHRGIISAWEHNDSFGLYKEQMQAADTAWAPNTAAFAQSSTSSAFSVSLSLVRPPIGFIDSRATDHVIGSLNLFNSYTTCSGRENARVADGYCLLYQGKVPSSVPPCCPSHQFCRSQISILTCFLLVVS